MKLHVDFSFKKFAFYALFFFLVWHFIVSTYNSSKNYLVWTVYQSWYQKAFEEVSDLIDSNWQCATFEMSSKWKTYDIQWCKKSNQQDTNWQTNQIQWAENAWSVEQQNEIQEQIKQSSWS